VFSKPLDPCQLQLQLLQYLLFGLCLLSPWLRGSECTLLGMVIRKGYRHRHVFGLDGTQKRSVLLQALNPACNLSYEVLRTHESCYCRVVSAQVELSSVEVLMQMFQCSQDCK
jgi:hypothetical protein